MTLTKWIIICLFSLILLIVNSIILNILSVQIDILQYPHNFNATDSPPLNINLPISKILHSSFLFTEILFTIVVIIEFAISITIGEELYNKGKI
jgi:hypothetical protein